MSYLFLFIPMGLTLILLSLFIRLFLLTKQEHCNPRPRHNNNDIRFSESVKKLHSFII